MLSGSIIWDSGLNEVQPGGKAARADPEKFGEALKQIFIHKSWTTANLRKSEEKLQGQIEASEVYQDLVDRENGIGSTIKTSLAEISAIQRVALKTIIALSQANQKAVHARNQTKPTVAEMREAAISQSEWSNLHQRFLKWQKGKEDGNTSEGDSIGDCKGGSLEKSGPGRSA